MPESEADGNSLKVSGAVLARLLTMAAWKRLPVGPDFSCDADGGAKMGFRSNQEVPDPSVLVDQQRFPEGLELVLVICAPAEAAPSHSLDMA